MLDIFNKNDTIDLLVEEADFLCQSSPLVCVEKLTVSPTNRRKRAFLLEVNMSHNHTEYMRRYLKKNPWVKTMNAILTRCNCLSDNYHKKGIKNYLTIKDLKFLWFRDKAYLLKKPSIDRIDSDKHYTFENCRYIEWLENCRQGGFKAIPVFQYTRDCRLITKYPSRMEAMRKTGVGSRNITRSTQQGICAGGYIWKNN